MDLEIQKLVNQLVNQLVNLKTADISSHLHLQISVRERVKDLSLFLDQVNISKAAIKTTTLVAEYSAPPRRRATTLSPTRCGQRTSLVNLLPAIEAERNVRLDTAQTTDNPQVGSAPADTSLDISSGTEQASAGTNPPRSNRKETGNSKTQVPSPILPFKWSRQNLLIRFQAHLEEHPVIIQAQSLPQPKENKEDRAIRYIKVFLASLWVYQDFQQFQKRRCATDRRAARQGPFGGRRAYALSLNVTETSLRSTLELGKRLDELRGATLFFAQKERFRWLRSCGTETFQKAKDSYTSCSLVKDHLDPSWTELKKICFDWFVHKIFVHKNRAWIVSLMEQENRTLSDCEEGYNRIGDDSENVTTKRRRMAEKSRDAPVRDPPRTQPGWCSDINVDSSLPTLHKTFVEEAVGFSDQQFATNTTFPTPLAQNEKASQPESTHPAMTSYDVTDDAIQIQLESIDWAGLQIESDLYGDTLSDTL
ncbi:hypothetical protein LTR64_008833 [Lithohypha guttulata]|uniref:uncharacterized protein n=1 Tax=Lithohypha guttulata TaxID=1690604 RepID=UPI00315D7632